MGKRLEKWRRLRDKPHKTRNASFPIPHPVSTPREVFAKCLSYGWFESLG